MNAANYDDLPCTEVAMRPLPWADCPTTLERVASAYVREHVLQKSPRALNRAALGLKSWLIALGPEFDATKLTRADGRTVMEYERSRGVKSATIRRNMAMGVAALNHAVREGRLREIPRFQRPDSSPARIRWLTPEEYKRLESTPKPPRVHRFFVLAFSTGARSEAIQELTWDRVDFENRTIDYRVPGQVMPANKRRVVSPMNDKLCARLRAWHERRADDYVIGLSARGTPSSTYNAAKSALRAIGIDEPGVARHVGRHTFASWLLQRGVDIFVVAELLGDDVKMAQRVYGHLRPSDRLRALSVLPI